MKYCSIDIETTGLDHNYCQIIEFAAVVDNLKIQAPLDSLPKFQTYILHEHYIGEPYALSMHAETFRKIAKWQENGINICEPNQLMTKFYTFLTTLGGYSSFASSQIKINIAGKNFGNFDSKFIEKLNNGSLVRFSHRPLDPGSMYLDVDDAEPPSTEMCLKRAGLDACVAHTALEDAMAVIQLLRKKHPRKI